MCRKLLPHPPISQSSAGLFFLSLRGAFCTADSISVEGYVGHPSDGRGVLGGGIFSRKIQGVFFFLFLFVFNRLQRAFVRFTKGPGIPLRICSHGRGVPVIHA